MAAVFVPPMAAKAGPLPVGGDWLYEIKWDGVRVIATVAGERVTMQSRSGKTNYALKEHGIVEALRKLPDGVYDGEMAVLDANGRARRYGRGQRSLVLWDVLALGDVSVTNRPLVERRQMLEDVVFAAKLEGQPIAISPVFEDGEALWQWVLEHEVEGLVAKRKSSRYEAGRRSGAWVKVKQ